MHYLRIAVLIASALTLSAPATNPPARGRDDDDRGHKHEKREKHDRDDKHKHERHDHHDRHGKSEKRRSHDSFDDDDRVRVRDYYHRHRDRVPPGLAKKGGVPPGLAKKGNVIEEQHRQHLLPVPPDLEKLLPPPPHEVLRRIIGRDMVLVHKHTHKVLDVLHDAMP
jgi:hypothetical protein